MDNKDWEIQLNKQIPGLRRYARALAQDIQSADDLVQDCLERAWKKRSYWKEGTNLRAWLFSIMHNLFINMVRRKKLANNFENQLALNSNGNQSSGDSSHIVHDLAKCLSRLKPEYREVVLLAGLENMSYKEIAKVTSTPIGTVMSRLSRGREELRRLMAATGEPKLVRVK